LGAMSGPPRRSMSVNRIDSPRRPLLVASLTAAALIAVPFVLPWLGAAPNTVNRILVWGLFGIGFDILFGYTGLLSFGQSALYGTGGFVAAYLLTRVEFPHVVASLLIGTVAAAAVGYLVGLVALRRTGIYFAMITVAIAEVFYFVEFNPLAEWTGGENGLPGVPTPSVNLGFTTLHFTSGWALYPFLAFCYFVGIVIALRIVRSPVGVVLRGIRENPLRMAAVGHNIHGYKLAAFVIAAVLAGQTQRQRALAGRGRAQLEVMAHRELGKDVAPLRHVGDAELEQRARSEVGDVAPAAGRTRS